ncbi:MAG: hypothetical protein K8U03_04015 [Planctomycetia bacterium]|nr:hypothetical protein [Planctomycetia bacterium]
MLARYLALRAATILLVVVGLCGTSRAGDCLRRLGLGFSAGYHAPVACPTPGCCEKLSVWTGWKQACALPNTRPIGGNCGCAPCTPAPTCGSTFGLRMLPGCSACQGGTGTIGRAPLVFN